MVACPAVGQTPGFFPTGHAVGTDFSRVYGLSADGHVAAGASGSLTVSRSPGFTWTLAGGRDDFGLQAGMPAQTISAGISGDAGTVVGSTSIGIRAFVYHGPGTYQEIAPTGFYTATAAQGVSGDGSIVVGFMSVPQSFASQAFRWTSAGGAQPLGFAQVGDAASSANGISRDGTTIVGGSGGGSNPSVCFAWKQSTGMVALPPLPGNTRSGGWGVNFDGSIIVGESSGNTPRATMWRNGQTIDLGVVPGFAGGSIAKAVNDAGTVVVGYASGTNTAASIWTPTFGMEHLSDYLSRNGIQVPSDWTLLNATAVSADGLTIAGWGSNATTGSEGFVVTIPAPGSLVLVGAGTLLAAWRRRV